ncbi:MAG: cobalamin-binding protein [Candidatus Tectimicrobiota bacterium]
MRICSFLPSATEIIYALGLQDQLYGVSFECDYPAEARQKPKVVRSLFENIDPPPSSGAISQIIGERLKAGMGIYDVDLDTLRAADPDLLISQAICEVCAVSSQQVAECSLQLPRTPQILSLDPQYIGDVLNDIRRVAAATGTEARGEAIVAGLQARIDAVARRAAQATHRPRVLHLEWAEPVMCGGHWVPEMIELAAGINCFGDKEQGSFRLDWDAVLASQPEMIILMLCGYTTQRAIEDLPILAAKPGWDDLPAVRNNKVFAMDAGAYTSRSGPRLVQGLEIIAQILHPELFTGLIPPDGAAHVDGTLVAAKA